MGEVIEFIGREKEIEIFRRMLQKQAPAEGKPEGEYPGEPWILYIHDATPRPEERGGIGKTWLLHRLIEVAKEEFADKYFILDEIIDFSAMKNRDRLNVLQNLCRHLEAKTSEEYFAPFWEELAKYQTLRARTDVAPHKESTAYRRVLRAYAKCHNSAMKSWGKKSICFYDVFEAIENDAGYMMPAEVAFPMVELRKHSIAVIAGRNEFDWNKTWWAGRKGEVQTIALKGFDDEETLNYFKAYAYFDFDSERDKESVGRIRALANGRPILIALAVDLLNNRAKTLEELASITDEGRFLPELVRGILNLEKPKDKAILYMAHIYHRCNAELLTHLLDTGAEMNCEHLAQELKKLSFIREIPGEQFVLHDEMRRLVNLYLWEKQDPTGEIRRELSRKAIDYYSRKIEEEEDPVERDALIAERLAHKLYIDPMEGYREFDEQFEKAILARRLRTAELLLSSIDEFKEQISTPWNVFLDTYHRGWLLVRWERLDEAKEQIERGKAELQRLEKQGLKTGRMSEVANLLGYCYRVMGDWGKALANYDEAIRYAKEEGNRDQLAESLNNRANLHRLQGKMQKAREDCRMGLFIREQLLKELGTEEAKRYLGNSLYVMGMIAWRMGNTAEASKYFRRAYRLYKKIGDEIRMALVDKEVGYMYFRTGDDDKGLQYLQRAGRVLQTHGWLSEQADALNMIGRIYRDREQRGKIKRGKAEESFSRALALAEQAKDYYRMTESNLSFAFLYYTENQPERAKEHCEKGLKLARKYGYILQEGLFEGILGDIAYDKGDEKSLREAFQHYLTELRLAAQYGEPRFFRALEEVENRLAKLPKGQRDHYCDYLIARWRDLGLESKLPALPNICQCLKELL